MNSREKPAAAGQGSMLEATLAAATRDVQTVTPDGEATLGVTDGVRIRDVPTHSDERGSVFELYDARWNFHPDPLVFAHACVIRPGYVKGWGLHKLHEDRHFILAGEVTLVLYDPRPDSPTCGEISRVALSEHNRRIVSIPRLIWHAEWNIGGKEAVIIDFPTAPYDHASPDKYRLPIDTPLIPFSFGDAKGW